MFVNLVYIVINIFLIVFFYNYNYNTTLFILIIFFIIVVFIKNKVSTIHYNPTEINISYIDICITLLLLPILIFILMFFQLINWFEVKILLFMNKLN